MYGQLPRLRGADRHCKRHFCPAPRERILWNTSAPPLREHPPAAHSRAVWTCCVGWEWGRGIKGALGRQQIQTGLQTLRGVKHPSSRIGSCHKLRHLCRQMRSSLKSFFAESNSGRCEAPPARPALPGTDSACRRDYPSCKGDNHQNRRMIPCGSKHLPDAFRLAVVVNDHV